jgi:hypothetical protein
MANGNHRRKYARKLPGEWDYNPDPRKGGGMQIIVMVVGILVVILLWAIALLIGYLLAPGGPAAR